MTSHKSISLFYIRCPISLVSIISPVISPGIAEREALLPSFHLSSVGPLRRADADGLEPVPLSHLPLQNLLCLDPALPLLPVSVREGRAISTDFGCCMRL